MLALNHLRLTAKGLPVFRKEATTMDVDDQSVLVIDTETGGFSPRDHSLLTIAGIAWTPHKQPQPLFSFMVKEDSIKATPKALEVNHVNLDEVNAQGLTPSQSVKAIRFALDQHYGKERQPVMLAGHNISFDVGFVQRLYRLAHQTYSHDFSKRTLDTVEIFNFFMISGLIPSGHAKGDRMFKTLGIPLPEKERHTALGDAWATALCLSRMAAAVHRGQLPKHLSLT